MTPNPSKAQDEAWWQEFPYWDAEMGRGGEYDIPAIIRKSERRILERVQIAFEKRQMELDAWRHDRSKQGYEQEINHPVTIGRAAELKNALAVISSLTNGDVENKGV